MCSRPFAASTLPAGAVVLAALAAPTLAQSPIGPRGAEQGRTDRYGDPLPAGAVARLGTLRFCQPVPWSLAFSPDGKVLACGGYDSRIWLWDPVTGKEVRVLEGHRGYVNGIAFSADGKRLASGSQAYDLRLWDVDTGKELRQFVGHDSPIECMALSPDGKILASSCQAGVLRLWDADTGKEIRSLPIDKGRRVSAMTFTPDSKHFAFYNRADRGIQLVDLAEGKMVRAFLGHTERVLGLVFTLDGATLISGGFDRTIRAWDVATGKELRRHGDEKEIVRCLALAPDGKTLTYGTCNDGLVHIWDLAANRHLVPPWKASRTCAVSVAYSPDGKKVAVCRDCIAIHDAATGKRLNPTAESEEPVRRVEYSPDGKALAVQRQYATIELWDAAGWQRWATLKEKVGRFTAMAFSPDGKHLTTAESDFKKQGSVCHWDRRTGERLKEFPLGNSRVESLSYSADGQTLFGLRLGQNPPSFVLWDPVTGQERKRWADLRQGWRVPQLSPDGRVVASWASGGEVVLLEMATGVSLRTFGERLSGGWDLIAFSPDARTIATPGGKGLERGTSFQPDVVLWETATGRERLRVAPGDGQVVQFAFSPDGRMLATAGRSETIRVWDAWTGSEVGRFTGHRGELTSLSFSPDGRALASGGADSTVLIWDVSVLLPAPRPAAEKPGREGLGRCRDDLAGQDAGRAYRAMAELARRSGEAERLIEERLPAPRVTAERLARLIADLDAEDFDTRDNASQELAKVSRVAEGALRKALDGNPSPEAKRRLRLLLEKLGGKVDPEWLLLLRSIEVLERLGTPEARRLLNKVAKEAADPDAAREAKASSERLTKTRSVP